MNPQTALNVIALIVAIGVIIPITMFVVECLVAIIAGPGKPIDEPQGPRPSLAILVPAHDEEPVIAQTLQSLKPQLTDPDRLIVIADNCSDRTAEIAREEGAEVLEREDLERRGKGFALAFGVDHLRSDPPQIVIVVDADCDAHEGMVEGLARTAASRKRPTQAVYLLESPPEPTPKDSISALAVQVKNRVRPIGMYRLGMPCLLDGAGMAFPWSSLQKVELATGNIVEDIQLGFDLALAGEYPLFCPHVRVTSRLPAQRDAATSQRTRWEHGHLQTLIANVPRLLFGGLTKRSIRLLGLALDLCIPPLSFLVLTWGAVLVFTSASALWTEWWGPTLMMVAAGGILLLAILGAWARYGRATCSARVLLSLPFYVLWKVPMYFAFFFKRQKQWIRTARDENASKD